MHFVVIPERTEKSIFATKGDSLLYVKHVVADGGIVAKEIKNRSGIGSCSGCEFRGLDFGSEIGNGLHSNALSRAARSGRHRQQAALAMTRRGVGNAFMHSSAERMNPFPTRRSAKPVSFQAERSGVEESSHLDSAFPTFRAKIPLRGCTLVGMTWGWETDCHASSRTGLQ